MKENSSNNTNIDRFISKLTPEELRIIQEKIDDRKKLLHNEAVEKYLDEFVKDYNNGIKRSLKLGVILNDKTKLTINDIQNYSLKHPELDDLPDEFAAFFYGIFRNNGR